MSTSTDLVDIAEANELLRDKHPLEIVKWAVTRFGDRLALQASMQKTATVLIHMITRVARGTEIVFVDTGVHFPETLALRDEMIGRFGANIRTFLPEKTFAQQREEYGRDLYLYDDEISPPGYRRCCELRKEIPFVDAVRGRFEAVIGGLQREEGGARKHIETIQFDQRIEAYKIYPLAFWTEAAVDAYIKEFELPVHPLYEKGYLSIGCSTCTTPVLPGEDKRAGRWRHIREARPELAGSKLYCGINLEDKRANESFSSSSL